MNSVFKGGKSILIIHTIPRLRSELKVSLRVRFRVMLRIRYRVKLSVMFRRRWGSDKVKL